MIMARWEELDKLLRRMEQKKQMAIYEYWDIYPETKTNEVKMTSVFLC